MSSLLQDYHLEDSEEKITMTKKQQLVDVLKQKGLLDYGKTISCDVLEEIFDLKDVQRGSREWCIKTLPIYNVIQSECFMCTSRGKEGALYIIDKNEMAAASERANKQQLIHMRNRNRALGHVDINMLEKEDAKKLEFERLRNAYLEIEISNKMKERCR